MRDESRIGQFPFTLTSLETLPLSTPPTPSSFVPVILIPYPSFMSLCFQVVIEPLTAAAPNHYAIWVLKVPYQAGHVHHDCLWTQDLTEAWELWQSMFSLRKLPEVPRIPSMVLPPPEASESGPPSITAQAMQHLGVKLWQWLFSGPVQSSFAQSQGIAFGQGRPLRLRLELRDPELMALPWEIMQTNTGMKAISLSQDLLFSRTTSEVAPLPELRADQGLQILLVLGQDAAGQAGSEEAKLMLKQEAEALPKVLEQSAAAESINSMVAPVSCEVQVLIQPTLEELIETLETERFNVLFYSGHGMPGPDGGMLFLRPDATMNGTELAQVLTRCRVKLAVFNACWGAQPERQGDHAIARSSLAEVLIHHGVPAVLGMRDSIADHEALSFIQWFARALAERAPIDEAVAIARQNLLTKYRFNQSTWTLPVLYMHPEFDGELVRPLTEGVTQFPDNSASWIEPLTPPAMLRSLIDPNQSWKVYGGVMRIGNMEGNDLILRGPGVSRRHAVIYYRDASPGENIEPSYYLKDDSRYGSYYLSPDNRWTRVHQREVPLHSNTRLRFGNFQLEFALEGEP